MTIFEGRELPQLTYDIFCFKDYFQSAYESSLYRTPFPDNAKPLASFRLDNQAGWQFDHDDYYIWAGQSHDNGFVAGANIEVLYFQEHSGTMRVYELPIPGLDETAIDREAPYRLRTPALEVMTLKRLARYTGFAVGGNPRWGTVAGDWQAYSPEDLFLMVLHDLDVPFILDGQTVIFPDPDAENPGALNPSLQSHFFTAVSHKLSRQSSTFAAEPSLALTQRDLAAIDTTNPIEPTLAAIAQRNGWCLDQIRDQVLLGTCSWIARQRFEAQRAARNTLRGLLTDRTGPFQIAPDQAQRLLDVIEKNAALTLQLADFLSQPNSVDPHSVKTAVDQFLLFQCTAAERALWMPFRTQLDPQLAAAP
ncbi:hypothetical protein [Acanthopleuribacter pedis]|uniref:Uncharacterized protein n=1 Tax=Acanthopleuribacter pedis TaxID=442870 RepID=A0A8J7QI75_9BACT|nr:hypothetical protein [Acanthopleuribacter pedis]MBO1320780.1 hypothetical protein [Acanthopleuribacter pedis]